MLCCAHLCSDMIPFDGDTLKPDFYRNWIPMGKSLVKCAPGPVLVASIVRTLQWRHNGDDSVSNHQPHDCLLNRLFRCRSKKTSKLRVTGLCAGNSPVTGEFPTQMASNAEMFPFDDVIMTRVFCRSLWSLCIGMGLSVFLYVFIQRLLFYFQYTTRVDIQVVYQEELPFPAVTICNQNMLRYDPYTSIHPSIHPSTPPSVSVFLFVRLLLYLWVLLLHFIPVPSLMPAA